MPLEGRGDFLQGFRAQRVVVLPGTIFEGAHSGGDRRVGLARPPSA